MVSIVYFGSGIIGYNGLLFVDFATEMTGLHTTQAGNNSYFYPAVTTSLCYLIY
jgi:hypothetical protein